MRVPFKQQLSNLVNWVPLSLPLPMLLAGFGIFLIVIAAITTTSPELLQGLVMLLAALGVILISGLWRGARHSAEDQKKVASLRQDHHRYEREVHIRKNYAGALQKEIDKQRAISMALQETESRLRAVLDNIIDGVVHMDSKGRIQSFNEAAEQIFGYQANEILGESIHLLMPQLSLTLATEDGERTEVKGRHKNGNVIPVQLGLTVVHIHGERAFVAIIQDITERKIAELQQAHARQQLEWANKELAWARDQAESANIAKSAFLANMSHEIRTPLNAIFGASELISYTDLNQKQKNYIENIAVSSEVLLNLINDILDLSKIEAGEFELELIPFQLSDMMEKIHTVMMPRVSERGLDFNIELGDKVPAEVIGDPLRLKQILLNFVSNAVKFTEEGFVKVAVSRVEKIDTPDKVWLRFEVEDSGIGVPEHLQGKIFEKFAQADVSNTRKYGGTGLGLSICREFIELMGGKVGMAQRDPHGSIFWCEIPLGLPATGKKL